MIFKELGFYSGLKNCKTSLST